jgi:hypothetical protein
MHTYATFGNPRKIKLVVDLASAFTTKLLLQVGRSLDQVYGDPCFVDSSAPAKNPVVRSHVGPIDSATPILFLGHLQRADLNR